MRNAEAYLEVISENQLIVDCGSCWPFSMTGYISVISLIEKELLQCPERNWSHSHGAARFHVQIRRETGYLY